MISVSHEIQVLGDLNFYWKNPGSVDISSKITGELIVSMPDTRRVLGMASEVVLLYKESFIDFYQKNYNSIPKKETFEVIIKL